MCTSPRIFHVRATLRQQAEAEGVADSDGAKKHRLIATMEDQTLGFSHEQPLKTQKVFSTCHQACARYGFFFY